MMPRDEGQSWFTEGGVGQLSQVLQAPSTEASSLRGERQQVTSPSSERERLVDLALAGSFDGGCLDVALTGAAGARLLIIKVMLIVIMITTPVTIPVL